MPASSAIFFNFSFILSFEVSAKIVRDFVPALIASKTTLSAFADDTATTVLSGLIGRSKTELKKGKFLYFLYFGFIGKIVPLKFLFLPHKK